MRLRTGAIIAAVALWGLAVTAGLRAVHSYEVTPGPAGSGRPDWPEGGRVRPEPGRANLVLLAHPRCPCTRASLDELARVAAQCRGSVAVHVVFYRPGSGPEGWGATDLRRRAAAIPGARVLDDPDGEEAARFGAETSGHALLYGRDGRLLFSGGITAGRGRAGASAAGDAVIALVRGAPAGRAGAPVFGCPIRETPKTQASR